ncbi:MAG: 6-phospho-3-hexuloisomerase [Mycetocola sp.]
MTTVPSARAILSSIVTELDRTLTDVSTGDLTALADRIAAAPRILLIGQGRSGLVLRMFAMRLMHLGTDAYVVGESTTPAIRSGDLLIAASGSGSTPTIVRAAHTAREVGAHVAVLSTRAESALADHADAVLVIPAAAKTEHGSQLSAQYSGSLFEQSLLLVSDALFQLLWRRQGTPAEELWTRHANLE